MKTPLAVVMMLSIAVAAQQQRNETQYPTSVYLGSAPSKMSISDVINLSRAGVSDEVIIQQLSHNGRRFALSSAQIVQLKKAGVSDRVVEAMIDPAKATTQQKQSGQPSDPPSSAGASVPAHEQPNIAATPDTARPSPAPVQSTTKAVAYVSATSNVIQNTLPTEPGTYVLAAQQYIKILGQPVTFERTGSRLVSGVTLHIKAAHDNVQLPGGRAQTVTGGEPIFAFIPSQHESDNGVTGGDLLLIKLETHGDRRQIEIRAGGAWRGSAGVSITHQIAGTRSEPSPGVYELTPTNPLKAGEYAIYLQRGEGLPALLFDFSVQNVR